MALIDDALLMELLDESTYVEESFDMHDDDEDRLRRVIQSLEAEIAVTNDDNLVSDCVMVDDDDNNVMDDIGGACSVEWMEEALAPEGVDTAGWYLEADDQLVEYGEMMREYNLSFCLCYNGEECVCEQVEYDSLWE